MKKWTPNGLASLRLTLLALLLMLCLNALGAMIPTGLFLLMDPANLEKLQTVCSAK
jgi:hypothetical protein